MADESVESRPKKSFRGYASKVFKESSVSAVSAIVSTGSVPRKVFRVLVFVLFTVGFLYQCIKFLTYILSYPTVVNIEIIKPDSYITPAYTFCNYNKFLSIHLGLNIFIANWLNYHFFRIKRSKFCQKFPEKCRKPDFNFCQKYNSYCGENETKVPKEEYFRQENTPKDDVLELGHDLEGFLKSMLVEYDLGPSGPFPRYRSEEKDVTGCFTFHSRVNSPLDPVLTQRQIWWKEPQHKFLFDPEENELFNPNGRPGVLFEIHSPFISVNPFEKGIFLKPGHSYRITISMQEEKLLPYPYKTDCLNYTDVWIKNNREGPRSQKTCKELCMLNSSLYCFNCSHPIILYPTEERICSSTDILSSPCYINDTEQYDKWDQLFLNCIEKCKDDCLQMKYTYDVSETYMVQEWKYNNEKTEPRLIKVEIDFEDSEIIALHYRPQFQEVEAFSYIGGFIGIWLGVSLVQVADFFESLFRIARYFCRKGATACKDRSASTSNETV